MHCSEGKVGYMRNSSPLAETGNSRPLRSFLPPERNFMHFVSDELPLLSFDISIEDGLTLSLLELK